MECQVCGGKSALPLCRNDVDKLTAMLTALTGEYLPNGKSTSGWLEALDDAACGNTRMGDGGGRRNPGEEHAPIRVNFKASDLMTSVRGTLARWVQDMCESRGIEYRPVKFVRCDTVGPLPLGTLRGLRYTGAGADLALWLLVHVDAIVVSEDAGMCFDEIESVITQIKLRIDRPPDMRAVGECPSPVSDIERCGNFLRAERDAIQVTCSECQATHNVERVVEQSLARADHMPWTSESIMQIVDDYGLHLNPRTWRHWRSAGVVKPCLYQRPNGRIGIGRSTDEDVPLYRLSDVRQAMASKGQKREKASAR